MHVNVQREQNPNQYVKEEFSILCCNYRDARRPMRWIYYCDIFGCFCLILAIIAYFAILGMAASEIKKRELCLEKF